MLHPIWLRRILFLQITPCCSRFFLNQDESQSEVLETDEIDLREILQRLKMGETVFIKYKNQETIEPRSSVNGEEEQNFW